MSGFKSYNCIYLAILDLRMTKVSNCPGFENDQVNNCPGFENGQVSNCPGFENDQMRNCPG